MAAADLFHIVKNHPFIDGNKRAGVVSALVFLALNGYDFTAPRDALAETVSALAGGELARADVAIFIRKWAARPE
jgi:death-on-curing protein